MAVMRSVSFAVAAVIAMIVMSFGAVGSAAEPTYWQDVRPLLRKHCTACHNEKNLPEVDVSGGMAMDSFEGFQARRQEAGGGPPGKAARACW